MLKVLPDLAEQIAKPLAQVDKITVISQDGASSGVNRLTADLAKIMAQVPEIASALTGQSLADLVKGFTATTEVKRDVSLLSGRDQDAAE